MNGTATIYDQLSALADPIRGRLLLALEGQELTVSELKAVLQLPQSTISRHLKVLSDEQWVVSRANGTSNWYRLAGEALSPASRLVWEAVREEMAATTAVERDRVRLRRVLAARHARSQQFFATSAGQWDRMRVELFGEGIEWLALAGLIEPHWTVADLGAGTGALARVLAPLARRVIAVDESPTMLEAARRTLAGLDSVELERGALESLPIETGSVHAAFTVLVLHHVPDPVRALAETARILVPAGRAIIVDMVPHDRAEYREQMGHQWLGIGRERLEEWTRAAGLALVSYRSLPIHPLATGPGLFVAAARPADVPRTAEDPCPS
jgi:ArsR family transcriptional regulator